MKRDFITSGDLVMGYGIASFTGPSDVFAKIDYDYGNDGFTLLYNIRERYYWWSFREALVPTDKLYKVPVATYYKYNTADELYCLSPEWHNGRPRPCIVLDQLPYLFDGAEVCYVVEVDGKHSVWIQESKLIRR